MDDKSLRAVRSAAMQEFGDMTTHSHMLLGVAESYAKMGYDLAMVSQIKEAQIDISIMPDSDMAIIENNPGLLLSQLCELGLSRQAYFIIRMFTASNDDEIRVGNKQPGNKVICNYIAPE